MSCCMSYCRLGHEASMITMIGFKIVSYRSDQSSGRGRIETAGEIQSKSNTGGAMWLN